MQKKGRIFIGYSFSEELQEIITEWQKEFSNFPVRWVSPKNLHITLVPPWYTQDAESVMSLLRTIKSSVAPFAINFEDITLGPDSRKPRLIWAKGKIPEEFLILKAQLTDVLQKEPDKRSPLLHVTLARFSREQFLAFANRTLAKKIAWKERVTSFSVIESHLQRTGAVYEILARIPLK